jgi:hypothetical protein
MTPREFIRRLSLIVAVAAGLWSGVLAAFGGFDLAAFGITTNDPFRPLFIGSIGLTLFLLLGGDPVAFFSRLARSWYDPRADRSDMSAATWRSRVLAAFGFAVFTAIVLSQQLQQMDGVPDRGDPVLSIWRMGWVYHQLLGDPRPLFNANIFHPYPLTLTYSDSMLLPALTGAPLLALGLSPVVASNIVLVFSFWASAFTAYLLAEHLTGSSGAAFIAGLLFGFHPFRSDHYSHFELLMVYWAPLALLAVHRFLATPRLRFAVLGMLFAAAQLYSSMYVAVFLMWQALFVAVCLCLVHRPQLKRLVGPALVAAALGALLAGPLVRTYSAANLDDRPWWEVEVYSATLSDYLRVHPRNLTWWDWTLGNLPPERALFPGGMALAFGTLALVPPVGATRVIYLGATALMVEITRGSNGVLYPLLYEWLPFMRGLRSPARASILVGLALSMLAAYAVRRLLLQRSRRQTIAILAVLTAATGVDLRLNLEFERVWPNPPAIYSAVAGRTDVALAEFPMGSSPGGLTPEVAQMYFSLWHWAPMLNGYSGHGPPDLLEFWEAMQYFPEGSTIDMLIARGATHVTVNCALYEHNCYDLLARLDGMDAFRLVASSRWRGYPVHLYELTR